MRHPLRASRLVVLAVAWALLAAPGLYAQKVKAGEYEVKATYLYNFGKFVGWPSKAGGPDNGSFTICILGQDPFGGVLDAIISGETIGGKNVLARRIPRPQDAAGCRILFISASEEKRLNEILAALDQVNVLTVSDMQEFTRRGGMIQFVMVASKVRFEVNLTSAERAGLILSSELLKVAASVRRGPSPGG